MKTPPGSHGPIVVRDRAALADTAAEWLASAIRAAVAARGRCAVALSGGRTPGPLYSALAGAPHANAVDWGRVEIFFADERGVPTGDARSNYRLVAETLLAHLAIPPSRVHRMEAERPDIDAAAAEYARVLPEPLDVLLLGMGPDGHTASLFPGSPALEETGRRVVSVVAPRPPQRRLTITPPVIAAARAIAVLATGHEKAAVVARALEGPGAPRDVPVQLAARGIWFLDPSAAARLTGRA